MTEQEIRSRQAKTVQDCEKKSQKSHLSWTY